MKHINMFSDGACSNNGISEKQCGGFATILEYKTESQTFERIIRGSLPGRTNNYSELRAVIEGLECIKEESHIDVFTDSQYVVLLASEIEAIVARGWRTKNGKELANKELWIRYYKLSKKHMITLNKVKAHADHYMNCRCDNLAVEQTKKNCKLETIVKDPVTIRYFKAF